MDPWSFDWVEHKRKPKAEEQEHCESAERLRASLAEESSLLQRTLTEETRLFQIRLAESQQNYKQVLEENEHLKSSLNESSMVNTNLQKDIKEVEGRMAGVEARLQTALNQLAGEQQSVVRRTSVPNLTSNGRRLEDNLTSGGQRRQEDNSSQRRQEDNLTSGSQRRQDPDQKDS